MRAACFDSFTLRRGSASTDLVLSVTDLDTKYQKLTISSPAGHAEIMRFDADSDSTQSDDAAEEITIQA